MLLAGVEEALKLHGIGSVAITATKRGLLAIREIAMNRHNYLSFAALRQPPASL